MIRAGMMALLLGGQGAVPADAPVPMRPVSKWNLEYAPDLCVLSRRYGNAASPVTVGFRPTPMAERVQTVVLGSRKAIGYGDRVKVRIGTGDPATATQVDGVRNPLKNGKDMGVSFDLPREVVNALAGSKPVAITLSGAKPMTVALSLSPTALAGLKQCETDLMTSWGFDPARIAAASVPAGIPAEGNSAQWIVDGDFPDSKLGWNATVTIAWVISTEGRISRCRVVRSSGIPEFDAVPCKAIEKRGRYTPARDIAGNPVESYASRTVRFQSGT